MTANLIKNRPQPGPARTLDAAMKWLSRVGAIVGFSLMIAGFLTMLFIEKTVSIPGHTTLPLEDIFSALPTGIHLPLMSLGILVLALLPIMRVLLAMVLYLRQHQGLNAAVALVVLVELVLGTQLGGR